MHLQVKHLAGQSGVAVRSKVPTGKTGKREIEKARDILNREVRTKRGDKHVEFHYGSWNGTLS